MICPQCGEPNAEDAVRCEKCGEPLGSDATATAPSRMSRLAVASFVLAVVGSTAIILFSLLCLLGFPIWVRSGDLANTLGVCPLLYPVPYVIGVLLGVLARRRIRASPRRLRGMRLARAGISLGACNIVLGCVVWVAAFFADFAYRPMEAMDGGIVRDMRALADALEAYYVDFKMYPAWGIGSDGPDGTSSCNYSLAARSKVERPLRTLSYRRIGIGWFPCYKRTWYRSSHPADLPGFLLRGSQPGQRFSTLTTPIGYINSYPGDWFSPLRGATFVYWSVRLGAEDPSGKIVGKDSPTSGVGWILISAGPDRRYDILPEDCEVYNPSERQPSERLIAGTNKKGRAFTYDPTNGMISDGDIWRVKE